ncbi:uncharacterized protein LOC144473718, partial [Augochlora pura]
LSVSGQQQQGIAERKTQLVVSHAQPGGSEIVQQRSTPCQFSTFKSSPVRVTPEVGSLDVSGLSLGQRDAAGSPNRDYQPDVDREVVTFDGRTKPDRKEDRAASAGSLNCFGSVDRDPEDKKKGCRRTDARRHSGNVEFLDEETEFFKNMISSKPKKNFSFASKEKKAHRSLESMGRSVDLSRLNRLVLLFDDRPKTFCNCKQRSLDYSQRSKKSMDTSANKAPSQRRPSFFQRVRRSWHFLIKQRRIRRRNKYERPQSVQEKCEYFLQKYQKNELFVLKTSCTQQATVATDKEEAATKPEDSTFRAKKVEEDNLLNRADSNVEKEPQASPSTECCFPDETKYHELSESNVSVETKPPDLSSNAQDTLNGNKEPDVGYSTSQLGKLCLQNMQNANRNDALYSHEVAGNDKDKDKEEQFMDWIVGARLDTVSRGTNTSDSLGHGKLDRNLDTLTGILLDMFICICI